MTSSDYRRYKVGITKHNPMQRLNQLKTGDPLIGFQVAYFVPETLGKLSAIEKKIHEYLGPPIKFHNGELSEWFVGEPQDVWMALDKFFSAMGYEVTDVFSPDGNQVVRFFEEMLIDFYEPPPELDEYGIPW